MENQVKIHKEVNKSQREPLDIAEKVFGDKVYFSIICGIIALLIVIIANYITNVFYSSFFVKKGNIFEKAQYFPEALKNIKNIFIPNFSIFWLPGLLVLILFLFVGQKLYLVYRKYRKLDYGQYGDSKFVDLKDLKKEYKTIYQQEVFYKGNPGFPITHFDNKYLIDTQTHNQLIIGTSRSGKGESIVFPAIDIDSRAENQPALILGDPKGELYSGSADTLIERGYEVYKLDLSSPDDSMSYNPLQLIKEFYEKGNISRAEKYTNTLTTMMFHDPRAKDPFWNNSGANLVKAIILALLDKCYKENEPEKVTMYNVANMLTELGSKTVNEKVYIDDENVKVEEKNALDLYFEKLPQGHVAKNAYAQSNFAKGNTRSSIFSVAAERLNIFTEEELGKMTSLNDLDMRKVGFNRIIDVQFDTTMKYLKGVYYFTDNEGNSTKAKNIELDNLGNVQIFFDETIENGYTLNLEIYKKQQAYSKSVYHISNVDDPDKLAVTPLVEEGERPQKVSMHYSKKPVAIFLVIPDFDTSTHIIASYFISQLYTLLAETASSKEVANSKTQRRVIFRLDEFGNLPAINDMDNIVTVCLGRNIIFNLFVQSLQQLQNVYGENTARIIEGNCQNLTYILSLDTHTAKTISERCGYHTVTTRQQTSNDGQSTISRSRSAEKQPLISETELLQMKEGDTVVVRSTSRTKMEKGTKKKVRPHPIYNTGKTSMPYRYQFLGNRFDPNATPQLVVESQHKHLKLKDNILDWNNIINREITEKEQREAYERENNIDDVLNKEQLHKFKIILRDRMHLTNDEANYILSQKISKAKFFLENDHRIQDKNEHAKKIKQLFDDWLNYNKEGGNEDESVG
ncbi:type IV secretory system conjugative DNA transfer family protein [Staphylococcus sp. RIT622]|uniref:VirD4-like conjugal transfer protein, CD1115 family n=1 Tax=Staphylococcus sp. RIT622 TaxID=2510795 RepID=UPI00101E2E5C|nr:type IV secretory system conjugative DNA transfer family protein [Staphylococcus sp. RIT622]MCG2544220.1 type IV secretory system conjugative DNA transfer family protein [Staphylococcus epidermidis]RYL09556.1 conjugal transfer protein TraM [Staphylococcus sp. RIT622]